MILKTNKEIEELVTHLIVTKIEPAMALSFYPRLDTYVGYRKTCYFDI